MVFYDPLTNIYIYIHITRLIKSLIVTINYLINYYKMYH